MMVVRSRLQLTLAILKPDLMMHPVRTKKVKEIIKDKGFLVVQSKVTQLNQQEAEKFYEEHKVNHQLKTKELKNVEKLVNGPLTAMILARENCITLWRDLMGPTKTYRARDIAPTSIRALYGISDTRNATHGSDSGESAQKEIGFFFPDFCSNHWGENLESLFREKRHKLVWDDNQGIHYLVRNDKCSPVVGTE